MEIGGDGQGTDGSEASHMRERGKANFTRGYAWWLLKEAKARNPDIETYALAESWPRWVANNSKNPPGPLDLPELAAEYIVSWVAGAREVHNLTIDWVGLWNEHYEVAVLHPQMLYVYAFVKHNSGRYQGI